MLRITDLVPTFDKIEAGIFDRLEGVSDNSNAVNNNKNEINNNGASSDNVDTIIKNIRNNNIDEQLFPEMEPSNIPPSNVERAKVNANNNANTYSKTNSGASDDVIESRDKSGYRTFSKERLLKEFLQPAQSLNTRESVSTTQSSMNRNDYAVASARASVGNLLAYHAESSVEDIIDSSHYNSFKSNAPLLVDTDMADVVACIGSGSGSESSMSANDVSLMKKKVAYMNSIRKRVRA